MKRLIYILFFSLLSTLILGFYLKQDDFVRLEFIYYLGNAHIYEEHKEALETQIQREPFPFPSLHIKEKRDNINDYTIDDFKVEDYQYHASIKMKMNQ